MLSDQIPLHGILLAQAADSSRRNGCDPSRMNTVRGQQSAVLKYLFQFSREKFAPPPLPGALKRGLGPRPYRARGPVL